MTDLVSPLLQWLNAHPQLAGLVTFLISAGESVAILGTIVPGSIMMTALGALAGAGIIPLWETIFWAILGAIVGDGISYWIGHYFKDRLPNVWPFRNYPKLLESGEIFFHKYGSMSVFIGRFVGPVRALVPLVAGMLGMKPLQFTIANVTSAIGWAPAYMLPGIMLGAASLELPPDIAVHVMLVLLLIVLFVMLCLWFIYKFAQLLSNQIDQAQNIIWAFLKKSRQLAPITVLLKHHNPNKSHGQLNLAFYFLFCGFLFFVLAAAVMHYGAPSFAVNDALYHFFRGIRSERLDNVMLYITLLGQKQVVLPVIGIFFAWVIIGKRWRLGFHALVLGVLAAGSVYVMKNIIKSPRPWGILYNTETYSMPSGHATLSTCLYMGLAFLIATAVRPKWRWPIYTLGVLITLAVGISRCYLGAHWFTDVLSSWLLSGAVLIFVIISYQRTKESPIKPFGILVVTSCALALTTTFFAYKHLKQMKIAATQISWPTVEIDLNNFWEKNSGLPAYRTSLFGFPSQNLNVEWVGNLEHIHQTLLQEGWTKAPARDWISTLHRIADIQSTQYLSLASPQYLDKKPALILARPTNKNKDLMVIRLWDSNRIIKESREPLWVGTVGIVPRSYSWLFKSHSQDSDINLANIFPQKTNLDTWQSKIYLMNLTADKYPIVDQKIILIRPKNSLHQK